ncbi:MAG: SusE domain-containing protein, partial [Cyclobacteriaceae bacterium]|nr:SusE domain-containing protein [Cyclobacteriaceae bacterium]
MMQFNRLFSILTLLTGMALIFSGCEDETPVPVLGNSSTFSVPAFDNSATGTKVFTPETATSEFENFTWSKADYGISLPVNYILEMDTSGTFTNPESLANTAGTSTSFTVED